ncbi:MAG TPA: PEP-utilizing enzyme [Thermoleophilaceae bacterium]|jgi:pyruvate,water dikinase
MSAKGGRSAPWELEGPGWELDRVHFDRPVTAFTRSYYVDLVSSESEHGFADFSVPIERYRFEVVNGWAYGRVIPFGGDPPGILEKLPALAHLWRVDPRARRRIRGFDEFVRSGGFERAISRWDEEWRPEADRRVRELRSFDPGSASDEELAANLAAWLEYCRWTWTFHLNLHLACFYVRARFRDVCRDRLGLSDFEAYELLKRSDPVLLSGSAKLSELARRSREDEEADAALGLPADQALERLRGTWFDDGLREYVEEEGDRSGSFELSDPTWREMPELVVGMVKGIRDAGYDPVEEEGEFEAWRRERVEELRGRLAGAGRREFDHWLALGERAYPLNETHNRLLVELPWAFARYSGLEAGRRLAEAGRLEDAADVFHLRGEEVVEALRGAGGDVGARAAERRLEYERAQSLDPPHSIGPPPPDPPYHALPDAVGSAMQALLEQTEEMLGAARAQERDGSQVVGSPGSPGRAEGPARVIRTIEEFDRVQPGDVLVCPLTNPSWTVLFPQVAALVTDSGGPLSHAAIVAREYGVPSVVGTLDATRRLSDGQHVSVDGTAGTVRVQRTPEPVG